MSISTLLLPRWGLPWAQKQPSVTPESRKRWCWRADERFPLVAPEWSAATRRFSCLCPSPPIPWPNYRPTLSPMGIDSVNWVVLFVVNERRLIFFLSFLWAHINNRLCSLVCRSVGNAFVRRCTRHTYWLTWPCFRKRGFSFLFYSLPKTTFGFCHVWMRVSLSRECVRISKFSNSNPLYSFNEPPKRALSSLFRTFATRSIQAFETPTFPTPIHARSQLFWKPPYFLEVRWLRWAVFARWARWVFWRPVFDCSRQSRISQLVDALLQTFPRPFER